MEVQIEPSWKQKLAAEFEKPYFAELTAFVKKEYAGDRIYPPPKNIFRAFDLCPFENVKVVILGQDPYHGARQANGLAFAVDEHVPIPPSLNNIFKEIQNDVGGDRALSDCREHLVFMLWGNYAKQKGAHIDRNKHLVLEAPHPSPFSAANGFFGCKHFSKANEYLVAHGKTPIDWL